MPTTKSQSAPILIVGRGIAALQMHRIWTALAPTSAIVVIGPPRPSSQSAAALPHALVHPFPGRSFNVPSEQWDAISALRTFLRWIDSQFPDLIARTPMTRPLLRGVGDRLAKSVIGAAHALHEGGVTVERITLPEGFLTAEALRYGPGAIIDLADLLARYWSVQNNVFDDMVERVDEGADGVKVYTKNGNSHVVNRVIWATGAAAVGLPSTVRHKIDRGSILYAQPGRSSCLGAGAMPNAWSAGVHLCRVRDTLWALGATHFEEPGSTGVDTVSAALFPALERALPGHDLQPSHTFNGARLVPADRRPVVGAFSPRQAVLTGFGGTGLLWSPICAEWLAGALLRGRSIPSLVDVTRFA